MPEHPSDYACLLAVANEKSKPSSRLIYVAESPLDWSDIGDDGEEAHVRAARESVWDVRCIFSHVGAVGLPGFSLISRQP